MEAAPTDAALVACGRSLSLAEVDEVADELELVNPAWTRRALRREALVAHLLPTAAAASALPEESARARARVASDLARLADETPSASGVPSAAVSGTRAGARA